MSERVFNFNPGPAVLPLDVLQRTAADLIDFRQTGLGVAEISHRSPEFEAVLSEAEGLLRELLSIGHAYAVLFCTGGATTQFSMVPMNLAVKDRPADYIITGVWAEKAAEEAKKFLPVHIAATSKDRDFSLIPTELQLSESSSYVHFTSNNTVVGTQFRKEPSVGDAVLVCDASSDILSRRIDINAYGVIYAGAQKNLGPAGVTIVIIRRDLLERSPASLPVMMNYNTYAKNSSLYNTPPTLAIYMVAEVLKWVKAHGGVDEMERRSRRRAAILYEYLDSAEFYFGTARTEDRSLMNITFKLANDSLETQFLKEAKARDLVGLKGHRTFGGMRASLYNAFPEEGVRTLVSFMKDFARVHGNL